MPKNTLKQLVIGFLFILNLLNAALPGLASSIDDVEVDCGVLFEGDNLKTPNALAVLPDGRSLVSGLSSKMSYQGYKDGWLIMFDTDGTVLWEMEYGEPFFDEFQKISRTRDHGYIAAGTTVLDQEEQSDAWLLKLDANGELEWDSAYGQDGPDQGWAVVETEDGGFVVAGMGVEQDDSGANAKPWVFMVDDQGEYVWEEYYHLNRYKKNLLTSINIARIPHDGYLLYGNVVDYDLSMKHNNNSDATLFSDIWFMKIAENGDQEWSNDWGYVIDGSPTSIKVWDAVVTENGIQLLGTTHVDKVYESLPDTIEKKTRKSEYTINIPAIIEINIDPDDGSVSSPHIFKDPRKAIDIMAGFELTDSEMARSNASQEYVLLELRKVLRPIPTDNLDYSMSVSLYDPDSGERIAYKEHHTTHLFQDSQIIDMDQDESGNYYMVVNIKFEFSDDTVIWVAALDPDLNCLW